MLLVLIGIFFFKTLGLGRCFEDSIFMVKQLRTKSMISLVALELRSTFTDIRLGNKGHDLAGKKPSYSW